MYYILDNYDSFVYNLAAYLRESGATVQVRAAEDLSLSEIDAMKPQGIIISPGPGRPQDAHASIRVLDRFQYNVPILGVCLGHQVIGWYYGAQVQKGAQPMHGKITPVIHDSTGVFSNLPPRFDVTRYHSLVVCEEGMPGSLRVTARSKDGAVMGIVHKNLPVYGIQFHPEAVQTQYGHSLLVNFCRICEEYRGRITA